jgi:hypothetical protein
LLPLKAIENLSSTIYRFMDLPEASGFSTKGVQFFGVHCGFHSHMDFRQRAADPLRQLTRIAPNEIQLFDELWV